MEAGWGGFRGLESEPLGFNDVWGHPGWGATGAAAFPIPARPPARPGFWLHWAAISASRLQPRRRHRARAWRRGTDQGKAGGERGRGAETGPKWRLSRGRAGKPGRERVRAARRVGTRGRPRV